MTLRLSSYEAAKIAAARYSQNRRAKLALKPSRKPMLRFGGEKHSQRSAFAKNRVSGKPQKRLKAGRKTKEWDAERRKLKIRFAAVGIMVCELRYPRCTFDDMLTWAHTKKRRHLLDGELSRVVLACINCHSEAELLGEAKMHQRLEAVINAREVQP